MKTPSEQIKEYPRDVDEEIKKMWYRFTAALDEISTKTRITALEKKVEDAEKVGTATKKKVEEHDHKIVEHASLFVKIRRGLSAIVKG